MNIKLGNNKRITSDSMQYIVQEEKIRESGKNKGEKYWANIGYYHKMPALLEAYGEQIVRQSDIQTFGELIKAYRRVDVELREISRQLALNVE